MEFADYREDRIREGDVSSHAECLAAMDCLMHHMSDEDEIACWLQDGVPDNSHWDLLDTKPRLLPDADERKDFYTDLVRGMTYGDYEACVMIFAHAVKAQCFRTKYQPRSFT